MQNPLIYLCSPYTHSAPEVREQRFEAACRATAELMRSGKSVFSPIVSSHPLCRYGLRLDWGFWQRFDLAFLAMCDEVIVLKLSGWQESVGVQAEIAAARTLGKPVTFLEMPEETPHETECEGKGE
jgi:hypothetical protein